jgi:hypothetical protein
MQSACQRVLCTPELLEAILQFLPVDALLHTQRISLAFSLAIQSSSYLRQHLVLAAALPFLPVDALFQAQRISRAFQDAIQSSKTLRRHLSLDPDLPDGEISPRFNSVLLQRWFSQLRPRFKNSKPPGVWSISFGALDNAEASRVVHLINMDVKWSVGDDQRIVVSWERYVRCPGLSLVCDACLEHRDAMESSAKDMYLSQPPSCPVVFKFPHDFGNAYRPTKPIEKVSDLVDSVWLYDGQCDQDGSPWPPRS